MERESNRRSSMASTRQIGNCISCQPIGRRHRWRRGSMAMDLGMNPVEEEVISTLVSMREAQHVGPIVNVDVIDDDITMWSSSREFSQAQNISKASVSEIIILDEDPPETTLTLSIDGKLNSLKRNRISWEAYQALESRHSAKKQCVEKNTQATKKPVYFCRVCWGPIVDGTSTKCGHIFCEKCITGYIKENKRCAICSCKLTLKKIHRVFLPDPDPDLDVC